MKSIDSVEKMAVNHVRNSVIRPFFISILLTILMTTCIVAVAIVLVVKGIVSIPPGWISAITGQPSPVVIQSTTILDKVQAMSQLTTTRYSYSSLITSQRDMPDILKGLYGDKELLQAVGYVNAGIDLGQIKQADINQSGGVLTIKLPPPQLQDCFLDEKASSVVSRDTGVFARPAPNLDEEARRFAVEQFRDMALKGGILDETQTHAQVLIQTFISNLGVQNVKQVTVIMSPPDPNAPMPDSCR